MNQQNKNQKGNKPKSKSNIILIYLILDNKGSSDDFLDAEISGIDFDALLNSPDKNLPAKSKENNSNNNQNAFIPPQNLAQNITPNNQNNLSNLMNQSNDQLQNMMGNQQGNNMLQNNQSFGNQMNQNSMGNISMNSSFGFLNNSFPQNQNQNQGLIGLNMGNQMNPLTQMNPMGNMNMGMGMSMGMFGKDDYMKCFCQGFFENFFSQKDDLREIKNQLNNLTHLLQQSLNLNIVVPNNQNQQNSFQALNQSNQSNLSGGQNYNIFPNTMNNQMQGLNNSFNSNLNNTTILNNNQSGFKINDSEEKNQNQPKATDISFGSNNNHNSPQPQPQNSNKNVNKGNQNKNQSNAKKDNKNQHLGNQNKNPKPNQNNNRVNLNKPKPNPPKNNAFKKPNNTVRLNPPKGILKHQNDKDDFNLTDNYDIFGTDNLDDLKDTFGPPLKREKFDDTDFAYAGNKSDNKSNLNTSTNQNKGSPDRGASVKMGDQSKLNGNKSEGRENEEEKNINLSDIKDDEFDNVLNQKKNNGNKAKAPPKKFNPPNPNNKKNQSVAPKSNLQIKESKPAGDTMECDFKTVGDKNVEIQLNSQVKKKIAVMEPCDEQEDPLENFNFDLLMTQEKAKANKKQPEQKKKAVKGEAIKMQEPKEDEKEDEDEKEEEEDKKDPPKQNKKVESKDDLDDIDMDEESVLEPQKKNGNSVKESKEDNKPSPEIKNDDSDSEEDPDQYSGYKRKDQKENISNNNAVPPKTVNEKSKGKKTNIVKISQTDLHSKKFNKTKQTKGLGKRNFNQSLDGLSAEDIQATKSVSLNTKPMKKH
ncbi:MAG: DUF4175 domain-containing protein [archaeon]|nr:DUF4175 domain-containing protein [archaeon]